MRTDTPVVPPDSVIKTFSHLKPERVDFILSQDREGLAGGSLLIRTGDWAKYFLDTWYDPLYRSYNFQKAEGHALEHIVQWHGTILAKLALVPQRVINSYMKESEGASVDGEHTHCCPHVLDWFLWMREQVTSKNFNSSANLSCRYLPRRGLCGKLPRLRTQPESQLRGRNGPADDEMARITRSGAEEVEIFQCVADYLRLLAGIVRRYSNFA